MLACFWGWKASWGLCEETHIWAPRFKENALPLWLLCAVSLETSVQNISSLVQNTTRTSKENFSRCQLCDSFLQVLFTYSPYFFKNQTLSFKFVMFDLRSYIPTLKENSLSLGLYQFMPVLRFACSSPSSSTSVLTSYYHQIHFPKIPLWVGNFLANLLISDID